jgi:3-oxoacyl-[acyl-carrier-protein] synthase II
VAPVSAVVVGAGAVTALGSDVPSTWDALRHGRSGIRPIQRFDASAFPVTFGAEIQSEKDGPALYDELLDRVLAEALRGLDLSAVAPTRVGVWLGSEAVRPDLADLAVRLRERRPDPGLVAMHHPARPANRVAMAVGAVGPVATLSIACTSSAQALGDAMHAIRRGEVDVALAGGVDVLVHPLMVLGFARLGALSKRNADPSAASRPFDRDRDGFVLGDGAGMVVLASEAVADRVGPRLGRLTGYGCSSNAWRITDTPPDGRGTRQAMVEALKDAGRSPEDVVYVNAHGTSTPQNDASEAHGIRAALGSATDTAFVSSTKSMMGHTVAACGVIEAIVSLWAARERIAPPTINLDHPDPDCALRHVPRTAAGIGPGVALSNSSGFGGSNATLVLEAP